MDLAKMLPQEGAYFTNDCYRETKYRKVLPKCYSQSEVYHNHIPPKGSKLNNTLLFFIIFIRILIEIYFQVLYQQFKFFLNLYFLIMAMSQFVPELRLGYLYTYWGPLVYFTIQKKIVLLHSLSVI